MFIFYYHTDVFLDFTERLELDINRALHETPLAFRQTAFLPQFAPSKWHSGEEPWEKCQQYLSALESEMSKMLGQHSIFFWMHLYRRIGVYLSPKHEGKVDANTLGLVRNIAEAAILKFGDLNRCDDVELSTEVKFNEVLGGHYRRLWRKRTNSLKKMMEGFRILQAASQWVLTDFSAAEFVAIYLLEGLAYEYWRTTAVMRALGKGASIRLHDHWFEYQDDPDFWRLIDSYDGRIGHRPSITFAGTWSKPTLSEQEHRELLPIAAYNVHGLGSEDGITLLGDPLPPKRIFTPNFLLSTIDIRAFASSNTTIAPAFARVRGYQLETLLATFWGLSILLLTPPRHVAGIEGIEAGENREGVLSKLNVLNLMQRGYGTVPLRTSDPIPDLMSEIHPTESIFNAISLDDVSRCIADQFLDAQKQQSMSIWSGGRRFPIIQHGSTCAVVDLSSIPLILRSLFAFIRHDGSKRGIAFEDEFRAAIKEAGYSVPFAGELTNDLGQVREMDASVRLGDTLYIFECISMERPLDYEIGRIPTIDQRSADLERKLDQVLSLSAFIKSYPKGKNYDFGWARNIVPFVASPFVEWICSSAEKCWHTSSIPRLLFSRRDPRFP